ncbi:TAXI family TRAP transporter solute-binding subunit [Massilia sp. 9096]|uniref:TAXI family TRAP transporter solute-binding subunit n=1 Tax=Massilia sp. 9096 TaxID=1500894 RepID=UPI00056D6EF9|nr:TAXI family TRAP transporter solute-binding subunit [Massilia sp. 9096]
MKAPRLRKFSLVSLRDLLVAIAPTTVLVAIACAVAYLVVDPEPPRRVVLATGQDNSAYEEFGRKYAAVLARDGIRVELRRSLGSAYNLQRLKDGQVDIAFVQSGSTGAGQAASAAPAARADLVSLGSLFTEPVWLFLRASDKRKDVLRSLTQLKGLRINLGPEGTGVPQLFRQLLAANNVEPGDLRISKLENTPATMALLNGQIDGLVFSSAPEAPLIQMLLQTPGVQLFDFRQAEAYTHRLPFLTHVVLPRGIVDLGRDIPSKDFQLIAPTATLVARADLHPALIDAFVKAATEIHGGAGWFQQQGQFPSPRYSEIPVAREAAKYYRDGPPFLQRYLSFWLANLFDRLWVVAVALAALVIPLSKVVPPLYAWRVRSRVYRWYGQLRAVELAVESAPEAHRPEVQAEQLRRLDDIERRVNHISIPLAYADALYGLRSHINLVRQRVRAAPQRRAEDL